VKIIFKQKFVKVLLYNRYLIHVKHKLHMCVKLRQGIVYMKYQLNIIF